ncbi:MAG TPA: sodium:calcium antiporter [Flavobacteriales bacterium]|nr:sodium:calcium antiporter [Flavobacteriales bacterium]HMR28227.1 sodium:calcium antiporter [Flavobacteriales bacterium]
MLPALLEFIVALLALLLAARFFTRSAEGLGRWLRFSPFVIGVFIVGIGTSLPELISAVLSVKAGASEIVPGNILGSSISNLLLITGIVAVIARPDMRLGSQYILIDLHFLIGAFAAFWLVAHDGVIIWSEAFMGVFLFIVYSVYLIRQGDQDLERTAKGHTEKRQARPTKDLLILLVSAVGIYFGADHTVSSITDIATHLALPPSLIALTVLSIGTTLPELAVNISAIRQGKAEMAVGNVLGSCIFNTLVIPFAAAVFGTVVVPADLLSLSLPVMLGAGLFFYLLTLDKRISPWEGWLFAGLYVLFLQQLVFAA